METAEQLEIRSVADQVYSTLLERILSGQLAPGTRLRQVALSERLGVSRTPLREALMRLATEGFVVFEPNRGATVANRDFNNMEQAWHARLAIEPAAARLAALHRTQEDIEQMSAAVASERKVVHDLDRSFMANRDFHLALVTASHNHFLTQFAKILWKSYIGMPFFSRLYDDPKRVVAWTDEHAGILRAIEAGEPDRAEALAREHISAFPPRAQG